MSAMMSKHVKINAIVGDGFIAFWKKPQIAVIARQTMAVVAQQSTMQVRDT